MTYPTQRIGFNHSYHITAVTSSTGRHTPVVDLGGLCLTSIKMSTVAWSNGTISLYGSPNSSSTSGQLPIFGSTAPGSVGAVVQIAATYTTTANRTLTIDPRLTRGLQYIMLKSSVTQGATRNIVLGLSPI